ncbi:MAG: WYL domain-containing protein [Micrococcales bacterium]|nr:WYL domain-containing protein [Micrococcales bacterium]
MESATARVARLLTMVPWLLSHPGVSIQDAAREFGVTPAGLERDLELLFLCGTPGGMPDDLIEAEWETGRIYLGNADTIARPLRLSLDEALTLIVALRAIEATGQLGEAQVVASTLAKLEEATGSHAQPLADAAGRRIRVQVADDEESTHLPVLRCALTDHRRVHLHYLVSSRDEVTRRDVDPMRLFAQDGHWYLEAFCHRADDVRLFRLDRIQSVQVRGVDGTPPERAQVRDLDAGIFQAAGSDTIVTLDLAPSARWVVDYYPHESVEQIECAGPMVDAAGEAFTVTRLTLRVADLTWVRRLLWRLGGQARVVDPPGLAADVARGARAALLAYGEDL